MSPENPPAIPQGLATQLGKYGALVAAVLGVLAAVFDVELDTESIAAFGGSVLLLITTIAGRMAQATAMYRDQPSVLLDRIVDDFDDLEDLVEEQPPSEDELTVDFPDNQIEPSDVQAVRATERKA